MTLPALTPWPSEALWQAVEPQLPGFSVEVLPEIDSTNSELTRRARTGQCDPVLLVAERQNAGRGRLGKPWHSGTGDALTFSLGLPLAPRDWSGLSLAVGVSIAERIDAGQTPRVALKWPNDLWVDDCKLGGILIETALPQGEANGSSPRWLVIGAGLNIGARERDGMRTPPAWVQQWHPEATPPQVLLQLAAPLVRDVLAFGAQGFAPFAARFAARDALRGREVQLSDGTAGRCEGVGPRGELRVHTAGGMQSITSSEVSVRPRGMAF